MAAADSFIPTGFNPSPYREALERAERAEAELNKPHGWIYERKRAERAEAERDALRKLALQWHSPEYVQSVIDAALEKP